MVKTIKELDLYCRTHNKVLSKREFGMTHDTSRGIFHNKIIQWVVSDTIQKNGLLIKDEYYVGQ